MMKLCVVYDSSGWKRTQLSLMVYYAKLCRQAITSLTSSGLVSLFSDTGDLLRSLHLYNLVSMGTKSLCALLSVCPNLTDLKIVDLKYILGHVLRTPTKNRRSIINHLFLEKNSINFPASGTKSSTVAAFATFCPNLTSLTLIGFGLNQEAARSLVLGFPKLNYMDLSRTSSIKNRFLRDLENSWSDSPLKTLVLRDSLWLKRGLSINHRH